MFFLSAALTVIIPAAAGCFLFLAGAKNKITRRALCVYVIAVCSLTPLLGAAAAFSEPFKFSLFGSGEGGVFVFAVDGLSRLAAPFIQTVWLLLSFFALRWPDFYSEGKPAGTAFFSYYLITLGMLSGLCYAADPASLFTFFVMTVLCSAALATSGAAIDNAAAIRPKLLIYAAISSACVLAGLIGAFGSHSSPPAPIWGITLAVGFGAAAGFFPLQSFFMASCRSSSFPAAVLFWAVLSKASFICIMRAAALAGGALVMPGGTAQKVWAALSLVSAAMGAVLSAREDVIKKKLAYFAVSQLSIIMLGTAMSAGFPSSSTVTPLLFDATAGGALMCAAGIICRRFGCEKTAELRGAGFRIPIVFICFTVAAAGAVGVPPFYGFAARWQLLAGAFDLWQGPLPWIVSTAVLLCSLLGAVSLFSTIVTAFSPPEAGAAVKETIQNKLSGAVYIPVAAFTLMVLAGVLYMPELSELLHNLLP